MCADAELTLIRRLGDACTALRWPRNASPLNPSAEPLVHYSTAAIAAAIDVRQVIAHMPRSADILPPVGLNRAAAEPDDIGCAKDEHA